ncbi:MAG TPA: hypothetical protein VK622_06095 [Puia sp.]|nr:hypothetical protein [Puia sp.]
MCEIRSLPLKFLLCCLIFVNIAGAQVLTNDTLSNTLYNSSAVKLYFNAISENAHIYTGFEYFTPDRNIKGSPYYLSDSPWPSDLIYDDSYYKNIPIMYDVVKDEVVTNRLGQNFKISLVTDKLKTFILRKHEFIRVSGDSVNGNSLATGFYDRLYNNKTIVLVKRKARLQETYVYSQINYEYIRQDIYYVIVAGQIVQVDSKSSVLKLFNSKKSEIKAFIRKNKLNFKSDFERTLVAVSAYYDQLTS